MGTRILAVRLGLVAKIAALDLSNAGVSPTVKLGYPLGSRTRERIWTQRARFNHEPASLRAAVTFRNEEGFFDVCVEVEGLGQEQADTSTRAVALGERIEDLIATHSSRPVVAGLTALKVQGDGELLEAFNDQGTIARLTLPVRYTARLTTE